MRESCQNLLRLTFTDLAEITRVPGQKGENWDKNIMEIQTNIIVFRCFRMLDTDYKFYLAFENSNCKDYITEKFFVNGLG